MIRQSWLGQRRPTIDCRHVGRVLQSYLDGTLEPEFTTKIAAHLEACRDCGLELETYERIKASLAAAMPEVDSQAVARLRQFGEDLTAG